MQSVLRRKGAITASFERPHDFPWTGFILSFWRWSHTAAFYIYSYVQRRYKVFVVFGSVTSFCWTKTHPHTWAFEFITKNHHRPGFFLQFIQNCATSGLPVVAPLKSVLRSVRKTANLFIVTRILEPDRVLFSEWSSTHTHYWIFTAALWQWHLHFKLLMI